MDRLFGRRGRGEEKKHLPEERGPLQVGIRGALSVDTLSLQASLAGQEPSMQLPDVSTFVIAGIGQSMLDADMQLTRYYDDEDRMIQVMGAPACGPEDIVDTTLFLPWDSVVPASRADWTRWTGPEGCLGLPTYDAEGTLFQRFWGDGDGRTELVEFIEEVEAAEGPRREIHQKCMLYARPLGPVAREMLLILTQRDLSGKGSESGASIEFMLGYGLSVADVRRV